MVLYEYNLWAVLLVPTYLVCFATGILVLVRNPRGKVNRAVAAFLLTIGFWILARSFLMASVAESTALAWSHLIWIGAVFIAPTTLHMIFLYGRFFPRFTRYGIWGFYALALWFAFSLQAGVEVGHYANWEPGQAALFKVFGLESILIIWLSLGLIWWRYTQVQNQVEKTQMAYMAFGLSIAGTLGPVFAIILPIFGQPLAFLGAFSTMFMGLLIGYSVLRYRLFDIEAVTELAPAAEVLTVEPGQSYLIREQGSGNAYGIFRSLVTEHPGLVLSTFFPAKLRKDHDLAKTPILWITETTTDERTLQASRLDFEVLYTLESFLRENHDTVILLDDLKYLSLVNGFDKTAEFLRTLSDLVTIANSTLLVPIDTTVFQDQQVHQLEGLFDEVLDRTAAPRVRDLAAIEASYSYMIQEQGAERTSELLHAVTPKMICLTKTYPAKLRKRLDLPTMEGYYWLTTSKKGDTPSLDPRRLEFEVTAIAGDFLREEHGVIFLHDVDGLITDNSLAAVSDLLKTLVDIASVAGGSVVASLDPRMIEPEDAAVLASRFDVVRRA